MTKIIFGFPHRDKLGKLSAFLQATGTAEVYIFVNKVLKKMI